MKTTEKQKKAMKAYLQTPKGQASRQKYIQNHKEELTEYNKKYQIQKKLDDKKNKTCYRCHKKPQQHGVVCQECHKKYTDKRKKTQ